MKHSLEAEESATAFFFKPRFGKNYQKVRSEAGIDEVQHQVFKRDSEGFFMKPKLVVTKRDSEGFFMKPKHEVTKRDSEGFFMKPKVPDTDRRSFSKEKLIQSYQK